MFCDGNLNCAEAHDMFLVDYMNAHRQWNVVNSATLLFC